MNTQAPTEVRPTHGPDAGAGISPEEIRAAIREGERLRAEVTGRAIVAAVKYPWQLFSRLLPSGSHRPA